MMRASRIAAISLALVLVLPGISAADCSITTTGVNFGPYDVFDTSPVDSTGSVRYQCSGNTPSFTIAIGSGSSPIFTTRTLRNGSETLNYNLYLDAARTSIWGEGTSGTALFTVANPTGKAVSLTIFGRIPAGQDVAAGSYTDSIVVTIQF